MTTKATTDINHLERCVICPCCDLMLCRIDATPGQKLVCCRCGTTLVHRRIHSINRIFALSVAGLLSLLPACLFPIIGVSKLGLSNQASLIDCINILFHEAYYLAAFFVFCFTLLIPAVRLFMAFYLSLQIKRPKISYRMRYFFRFYIQLNSWAMLQVFMLGIIVSMYKIGDLAELTVGPGLISLTIMIMSSTMLSVALDTDYVWQILEARSDND